MTESEKSELVKGGPWVRIEKLESALETALDEMDKVDRLLDGRYVAKGVKTHFEAARSTLEGALYSDEE